MNKIILIVLILTLQANSQKIFLNTKDAKKDIIENEQLNIITNYTIKLATYKNLYNAKDEKAYLPFETFIIKKNRYYGLYSGQYTSVKEAKKELKEMQKVHPDAFIIKTFSLQKAEKKINKIALVPQRTIIKTPQQNKKSNLNLANKLFLQKKYESALTIYNRELIENPNNYVARLDYARCLYQLKLYKNAKEEFQKVLAVNPPPNVQKNIYMFLNKMKKSKHKFTGTISAGVSYDDNLYYNTYLETTKYAGLELQNNTEKTEDSYENVDLLLKHQYKNENFKWENCFYSYNEFYNNEKNNNLNFLNISSIISRRYNSIYLNLPIGFSNIWIDGENNSNNSYIQPSITFNIAQGTNISIGTSYVNNSSKVDKERSHTKKSAKISMIKLFDKISTNASIQFEKTKKKDGKRFDISKEQLQFIGGLGYKFLQNSFMNINYYHEEDQYIDEDNALGYKREDKKNIILLSIKQAIKNGSLYINYTHTDNDSNINTYSYKKNSYKLGYGYEF